MKRRDTAKMNLEDIKQAIERGGDELVIPPPAPRTTRPLTPRRRRSSAERPAA
jgi:hypothetical protein